MFRKKPPTPITVQVPAAQPVAEMSESCVRDSHRWSTVYTGKYQYPNLKSGSQYRQCRDCGLEQFNSGVYWINAHRPSGARIILQDTLAEAAK